MAIQAEVREPATDGPAGRGWRRPGLVDSIAVVAAAAPFLVVGLYFLTLGDHVLGGDQALLALDALDVRHLDQAVGPYSRMGWAHPGPAWFVLLAPLYWLFGSTGEALVAASMLVNGLFAALVVVAAGTGRRWQRPLAAAVVLLYVLRMPAVEFVNVWNPFALLLPVLLLLLVGARAGAGSLPAAAATLVVGSFVVQTHVGTAPLVGLVGLVVVAGLVVRWRQGRLVLPRKARVRTGIAAGAAVLMWVPPLWQQLTASAGRGNLGLLAEDLLLGGGAEEATHTWREAVSAVGQLLGAPVYGWTALPEPVDTALLTAAVLAAVGVQLLGSIGVAVVAARMRAGLPAWLGVMSATGTVAALVSAKSVTGTLHNYLILWVSVLPAVLLFAGLSLVAHLVSRAPGRTRTAGVVVTTAAAVVLSAGVGASVHRAATTQLYDHPGAAEATDLVLDALPAPGAGDRVLLDIREAAAWSTATAVALQLEQSGYRVAVDEEWVYGFGSDRRSTGDEEWRIVFIPADPADPTEPVDPEDADVPDDARLGVVGGMNGPEIIALQERPAR